MDSGRELIGRAGEHIRRGLSELVPDGPVALLDCPGHPNVGDSAIWLGEREALRSAGRDPPVYTCTLASYDPAELRRRLPRGTILLSGGGNLGDLYPEYQRFRERVVRGFPRRRIVVLPQSVHFRRRENLERARRTFEGHPDLHLVVRTERSLALARRHFDLPVELWPDMAFALGPLPPTAAVGPARLLLLREDGESAADAPGGGGTGEDEAVADWGGGYREPGSLPALAHFLAWRRRGAPGRHVRAAIDYLRHFWTRRAWGRVLAGLRMISGSDVVITDRLHGHILACLAAIPNVVLDNSYGKVHAYAATWTGGSELVRTAGTLEEARLAAREMSTRRVGRGERRAAG